MSNRFVVIDEPTISQGFESFYEVFSINTEQYKIENQSFRVLQKGFEAYDVLYKLKEILSRSNISPSLESSVVNTFNYYKDIVEDYSPSTTLISLESHSDIKIKKNNRFRRYR